MILSRFIWLLAYLICATAFLFSCSTYSASRDVSALLTSSTEGSRLAIQQAVKRSLGNRGDILIAPDALTKSSILIIDKKPVRRIDNQNSGRRLTRGDRFRLVLNSNRCYLVHLEGTARFELPDTTCKPE